MAENASRLGGGTPTSTVNGAQEIYSDEVNITMIFTCSLVLLVGVAGNAMVGWCLGCKHHEALCLQNYAINN